MLIQATGTWYGVVLPPVHQLQILKSRVAMDNPKLPQQAGATPKTHSIVDSSVTKTHLHIYHAVSCHVQSENIFLCVGGIRQPSLTILNALSTLL